MSLGVDREIEGKSDKLFRVLKPQIFGFHPDGIHVFRLSQDLSDMKLNKVEGKSLYGLKANYRESFASTLLEQCASPQCGVVFEVRGNAD